MVGPFIDTLVICTLTGLTIITSGAYHQHFPTEVSLSDLVPLKQSTQLMAGGKFEESDIETDNLQMIHGRPQDAKLYYGEGFVQDATLYVRDESGNERVYEGDGVLNFTETGKLMLFTYASDSTLVPAENLDLFVECKALANSSVLTAHAFSSGLGSRYGSLMVTIGVFLFAISTAISWSYYGDRATVYLFGQKGVRIYRIIYVAAHFVGATLALKTVWGFGDIALSLMAFPNLVALLMLGKKIQESKEEYFGREHIPYRKMHF